MKLFFFPFLWFSRSKLERRLAGKTVLITGASYGIGASLAESLAATKCRLILVARTAEKLFEVRDRVEARGGRADVFPCDLTNTAEVDELLESIHQLGGVDVFVNNAGKSIRRSIFDALDRLHDFSRTDGGVQEDARDADGYLFLCGRVDDMIVAGGENVYPIELEDVLAQHPQIDSCGVGCIPDSEFGQRLKAVIAVKKGITLDESTPLECLKPPRWLACGYARLHLRRRVRIGCGWKRPTRPAFPGKNRLPALG